MGFLDKLKNVFFEEEEVEEEVENTAKLARKIEIPKKKTPVVENIKKEEVEETKIEVSEPVTTVVEEMMVREEVAPVKDEEVVEVSNKFAMMFEEDDFVLEEPPKQTMTRGERTERIERKTLYPEKKEESYSESVKKESSYGYTKTYYESRETRTFTPSPIISPIYGILDKNYKKEEVVAKKEIRISSASRGKVDLDSVRNKAFGDISDEILDSRPLPPKEEIVKEKEPEKETSVYDVNTSKPSVKGVTLEAADEYYRDLGLAYNVDYSDKAKEVEVEKEEKTKKSKSEDNLFDLIESMYDKED